MFRSIRTAKTGSRRAHPLLEVLEVRTLLSTALSDLGPLVNVTGINTTVNAVGTEFVSGAGNRAFLLDTNGVFHNLGTLPNAIDSFATGINSGGKVVGYSTISGGGGGGGGGGSGLPQGFLYSNGTMTALGTLGGSQSVANAINTTGQIVGWADTSNGQRQDAFLYSGGQMTDLGGLPGDSISAANAINDSGQVVGYSEPGGGGGGTNYSIHAWLYSAGSMTDLGTLSGSQSQANGINNSGQVVGWSSVATGGDQAFLWDKGTMTDLGTLPGEGDSVANSINDLGQVVGTASNGGGIGGGGGGQAADHAFLYENGVMTDLNSLLPPGASGWVLNTATAIDNQSQIAGMGTYNGDTHGYILDLSPLGSQGSTTTTALQASAPTSVYGQPVTLTVTVSPAAGGSGTPAGTVTFFDGSASLGNAQLNSGTASLTISNLPVGSDSLSASYIGNLQFGASTSPATDVTVQKDTTSVSLKSSLKSAGAGQLITFTAIVSPSITGGGTPTGSVTVMDGLAPLGTFALSGGVAFFPISTLSIGLHTITATYGGDPDFLGNTSSALHETITHVKYGTRTMLTTSAISATVGHPVTLTATVKSTGPVSGSPTGTVTFTDNGTTLRTISLSRGKTTLKTSSLPVGTNRIQVIYSGDKYFNSSMSLFLVETIEKPKKKAK